MIYLVWRFHARLNIKKMKTHEYIFVAFEILTKATLAVALSAAAICCISFSVFFLVLFLIKLV
jgi:hypothetical protein